MVPTPGDIHDGYLQPWGMQRQAIGTQAANVARGESKEPGWHARCVQSRSGHVSPVPPALIQNAIERHVSEAQHANVRIL